MADEFPGMARLGDGAIPTGTTRCASTESMVVAAARPAAISDQAAAYAADLVSMYVTAIAYEQSLYRRSHSDPRPRGARGRRGSPSASRVLDAERYPTIAALGAADDRGDGDERFELGLDVLINGLLRRRPRAG